MVYLQQLPWGNKWEQILEGTSGRRNVVEDGQFLCKKNLVLGRVPDVYIKSVLRSAGHSAK